MVLDKTLELIQNNTKISTTVVSIAAIATGSIFAAYSLISLCKNYQRKKKISSYPNNVVILHQFPRGLRAPSFSSFSLKLETWLRVAKIPYQNELNYDFSSKQLMPWITYNGQDIADSEFCIEFLSKKFNIDLDKNLNAEQKGISRAVLKLTEESLRWIGLLHRIVFHPDPNEAGLSKIGLIYLHGRIKTRLFHQGYGRHSQEECYKIGKADLQAINDIIGNKKFLMGNEVSNNDPALFGLLAQAVYHDRGPLNEYTNSHCPNILRYVETMKNEFWPDWNDNIREKVKC